MSKHRVPAKNSCPKSVNLYKFIRLILGDRNKIKDYTIAKKWKMDPKNFSSLKFGQYPVPRIERLNQLARVLGVNKHLLFEVASGVSARTVFKLIQKKNLKGQLKLMGFK